MRYYCNAAPARRGNPPEWIGRRRGTREDIEWKPTSCCKWRCAWSISDCVNLRATWSAATFLSFTWTGRRRRSSIRESASCWRSSAAEMTVPTSGDAIAAANREALRRILASEPVLVDVRLAKDAIPQLPDRTILHAGPPIGWDRMCGPMRGAVAGAIVFEGWAPDLEAASRLAASGEIRFEPNHHYDAVGPMTGMTTRNMAVLVVENRAFGNRAFCTVNEGIGNVMRFGGNDREVI